MSLQLYAVLQLQRHRGQPVLLVKPAWIGLCSGVHSCSNSVQLPLQLRVVERLWLLPSSALRQLSCGSSFCPLPLPSWGCPR